MAPVIARQALYLIDSIFWWNDALSALLCVKNVSVVKIGTNKIFVYSNQGVLSVKYVEVCAIVP